MELKIKKDYYFYKLYNLNIKSDFYLSELSHSKYENLDNVDINIINGPCPERIINPKVSNLYYTVCENEAMFSATECGRFYITNGDTIIIETIENPNYEHLKAYLLSRCFAILLFQRNTVALHGSSILFNDKHAYIFCGPSGAGKSSLSASLTLQGYKMLSDDLSVISFNNNNMPVVEPGFAQHKLCSDTMEKLKLKPDNLIKVDYFANKYALPTTDTFINKSMPIKVLVKLTVVADCNKVELTEVFGQEKLQIIFRNTFRPQLMTDIGLKPIYFKQCLTLAKNIKVFIMKRPYGLFSVQDQIELIKKIQD